MIGPGSDQQRRRVLVVAYVFPPSGGAGVQRVTKFVKYLPEFGWDCSVLTVANPSVPLRDDSLKGEIPASTVIHRARTLEPSYALKTLVSAGNQTAARSRGGVKRRFKDVLRGAGNAVLQPDAQILWFPHAVYEGRKLLQRQRHDAIFVTAPPFSSFLVGAELSRATGLPLILDYRDEWGISNRYQENRQKSRLSHRWQARMQRRVLRQSRAVIATTRRSAEALREQITECRSSAHVAHIYNGYDAADFASLEGIASTSSVSAGASVKTFRIVYVGTLWNLTSIEPVVQALQTVCDQHAPLATQIELIVAGRRTADQDALLDRLNGRPCRVIREDYLEHHRAIELMSSADALCLLLSDVPEAARVMPAKTFEYLALRRPILAIAPPGEVSELLSGCPDARWFAPSDVTGITQYFVNCATEWSRGRIHPDSVSAAQSSDVRIDKATWNISQFERRELTRRLAFLLSEACGSTVFPPIDTRCDLADLVGAVP